MLTGSEVDKVSNVWKTKAKNNSETRKEGLASNTDMTMCGRPSTYLCSHVTMGLRIGYREEVLWLPGQKLFVL